jgi:hypothetical protein
MNGRFVRVQVLAFLLGYGIMAAGGLLFGMRLPDGLTLGHAVTGVATTVVILAGPHLYLAVRGDGGGVPLESRWRFAIAASIFSLAWAAGILASPGSIGSDAAGLLFAGLGFAVLVGYFGYEALARYRTVRRQESL